MANDPLNGLAAFHRAAEARSFSSAAAQLGVTTAAMSQAIKRLESRLGVRLFDRTTRSVRLTEAGQAFLARCRPALLEIAAATDDLVVSSRAAGGLLRITLPRLAGPLLVEPHLADFLAAHPNLRVELSFDDHLVNIVEEGFDAGIRIGELVERDMVAMPLTGDMRLVVVGAPAYLARYGTPEVPRDLLAHNCLTYRFRSSQRIYKWELAVRGRIVEYDVTGNLIANDGDTLLRAAVAGIGLAHLFDETAAPHLASGALVPVLEKHWPRFPGFYFYYPQRAFLPLKTRLFLDFLRSRLGPHPDARLPLEPPKPSRRPRVVSATRSSRRTG